VTLICAGVPVPVALLALTEYVTVVDLPLETVHVGLDSAAQAPPVHT
jgi:hypothetical protein